MSEYNLMRIKKKIKNGDLADLNVLTDTGLSLIESKVAVETHDIVSKSDDRCRWHILAKIYLLNYRTGHMDI